jgi:hypothetical protein
MGELIGKLIGWGILLALFGGFLFIISSIYGFAFAVMIISVSLIFMILVWVAVCLIIP